MKKGVLLICACLFMGCAAKPEETAAPEPEKTAVTEEETEMKHLKMKIGDTETEVIWEENESVSALMELCPLTIQMSMYGGFEQVGPIGTSLPRNDSQTVTDAGDIVLYSGDQIVVFYGSNSWAYTRLGHIAEPGRDKLAELLGNGDTVITLTAE